MAACRFEIINQGHAVVPRSCAICGIGRCTKGLPDPYKQQGQGAAEPTAQPQAAFKIGDVVRLRSGGPQMTVATGVSNLTRLSGTDRVLCVWTDNGGYHEEQIPTSALRPS